MLRREGLAVGRIAQELGVAKSSVSVWVRGVPRGGELPAGALPMPAGQRLPVWSSGVAQRCGRCDLVLPDVCFNRHGTRRQWWCRECFRAYFRARGALHRDQSSAALSKRRQRAKAALRAHLRAHPCADCGERDIVVLECDHVRGRRHGIAGLVATGAPLATLREELARCDVVCVNCHRRRTTRHAAPAGVAGAPTGSASSSRAAHARTSASCSPTGRCHRSPARTAESATSS